VRIDHLSQIRAAVADLHPVTGDDVRQERDDGIQRRGLLGRVGTATLQGRGVVGSRRLL